MARRAALDYPPRMTDANIAKRAAAYAAADLVQDNTTIGLGSGSTFLFVLDRLA